MINNPIIRPYFLGVGMEMGGVALRFPLEHPTVLFVGPFCLSFFFKEKGQLNHRCRSRRWRRNGVLECYDQSHGGTRYHKPQEAV